jgi:hypothetical protein
MMSPNFLYRACAAVAVSAFFLAAPAFAEVQSYTSALKGSTEVPATDSKGTGTVDATYDTSSKEFSWTIAYSDLTGPAVAAHFHGPADATGTAPPVVPLTGSLTSPIKGKATLTDAQASDLAAGRWYFNIHTAAHPSGEIRGQLAKK